MVIRRYTAADAADTARLFYETIHSVCAGDYSEEQLFAWAADVPDATEWNKSFSGRNAFVAEENGVLAGFGDIDCSGGLDRLYVSKDFQSRGVGSGILAALESSVSAKKITVYVSLTAYGFFVRSGYRTVRENTVERKGVLLKNYLMEKEKL